MAIQSDHEFAPTQIARAVFPTAFRGYDQDAVRRFLSRLAAALEHQQEYAGLGELEARTPAHERVQELETEVDNLRDEIKDLELELVQRSVSGDADQAEDGKPDTTAEDSAFDEHRAIELLGQETARVLESARSAAADILKRAETQAASLKAQAKSELAEARRRAETLVSERQAETHELVERLTADAEATADRINTEAEEHRAAVLEESSKILTEAEALAESEQAEAELRAKQIVADAETLRQQVISELVVERRQAQNEMDRMTSARDRLAMSLAVARSELDEVADALVEVSTVNLQAPSRSSAVEGEGALALLEAQQAAGLDQPDDSPSAADTGGDAEDRDGDGNSDDAEVIDLDKQDGPADADGGADDGRPEDDRSDDDRPEDDEATVTISTNGAVATKPAAAKPAATKHAAKAKPKTSGRKTSRTASKKTAGEPTGRKKKGRRAQPTAEVDPALGTVTEEVEVEVIDLDLMEAVDGSASRVDRDTDTTTHTDTTTDIDADTDVGDAESDSDREGASASETDGDVVLELDLMSEGSTAGSDLNELPADGEALSLVEGFSTIELTDADETGGDTLPADDAEDARPPGTGSQADEDEQSSPADEDAPELVYSVLVNEPQTPEEVITTVASRTATSQPDRTRGDLLIDEPFTGRLGKEFAARDRALTRSGPNFRRQLRRALNDDQSEVLDLLRAGRGEIKVDELPAFGDQIDRYLAPLRRGLSEIAQAGAKAGGQADLSQSALDNLVRQLAKYIVDKVRIPTIQVLQETPDHDRERILEPIRALYRDFRNVGLPDLTEDALYEAFAIGLYDSIEPAAPIRWVVDPRSDPDPVCEINRQRDDVAKGEIFPSGHARPLSLPGCRCLVTVADY